MRPLTLHDFYDAEGSTLTLTDPDPEDEPLPIDGNGSALAEEKQLIEVEDATDSIDDRTMPDVSNDDVDFEGR